MKTDVAICDLCRMDGSIRPAVAFYWNKTYGRMFDVCHEHYEIIVPLGACLCLYTHPGACDSEVFESPNLGIFHMMPERIKT